MTAHIRSFDERVAAGLGDENLQKSLEALKGTFIAARGRAVAALPEFEALRDDGKAIKDDALANLDRYLEQYEAQVVAQGGRVHWARDAQEACDIVRAICREAGAKTVTKGKSMVTEEIGLNAALEADGLEVTETDAGEYILQLNRQAPSHIVMPTVHLTMDEIADLFQHHHAAYGFAKRTTNAAELIGQVRQVLRDKYFAADVGITGANFLVAETGSGIIVTNEGNGDLTSTLARVHVVVTGIEKVVPTLEDLSVMLRLLARSALGSEITSYTTLSSGPRRPGDLDGPEAYHVVLVDNGRAKMLAGHFREMLRCIRCGACMNHCPVYMSVGGHAYGSVYPGPMGSVLTPIIGDDPGASDLPHACTLNGRCHAVCPVKIPLPDLLRRLRNEQWQRKVISGSTRWGIGVWAFLATRPRLYRVCARAASGVLRLLGRDKGRLRWLPLASGWTQGRDLPSPPGATFHAQWSRRR
jgi:L-lactate dehydrogenase complex protein LldF